MLENFSLLSDIFLSYDTDIQFDQGDIKISNGADCLNRELYKLLITQPGDWKMHLTDGCSPNKFTGYPNNRETGSKIEAYLTNGLISTTLPAIPVTRCVPTGIDKILVFVDIVHGQNILYTVPLEFDYKLGLIYKPTDVTDTVYADSQYQSIAYKDGQTTNKYWSKLRESI